MPKQSKSKVQKGSLGFIYGGIIKTGYARLFCSDDIDPLDWSLSDFTPDSTSQSSLVLFGNTWKD